MIIGKLTDCQFLSKDTQTLTCVSPNPVACCLGKEVSEERLAELARLLELGVRRFLFCIFFLSSVNEFPVEALTFMFLEAFSCGLFMPEVIQLNGEKARWVTACRYPLLSFLTRLFSLSFRFVYVVACVLLINGWISSVLSCSQCHSSSWNELRVGVLCSLYGEDVDAQHRFGLGIFFSH